MIWGKNRWVEICRTAVVEKPKLVSRRNFCIVRHFVAEIYQKNISNILSKNCFVFLFKYIVK
jgi:hypothetical protein